MFGRVLNTPEYSEGDQMFSCEFPRVFPKSSVTDKVYLTKARHMCGMSKKEHILVNLGQFEDETPLDSM